MASRLTELQFDVDYRQNVESLFEFQQVILPEFRKKLDPGALVVFYFSGHGFGYGADNFLAPTEIPLSIDEDKVTKHAISVDALKTLIESHSPGLVLFMLDACRSISGFVVRNTTGENLVVKGPSEMLNHSESVNAFIAYATKPGRSAVGFSESERPSIFTEALIKYIRAEGQPLSAVLDDVAADVRGTTKDQQVPGEFDWSQTDPYLNPTELNLKQQKEAWLGARDSREYRVIRHYSYRYSVSRHAVAALTWLADADRERSSPYTLASPLAIDRAWRTDNEAPVSVRRLAIPFGFTRSVEESQNVTIRSFSDAEIGLVPTGMSRVKISKLDTFKEYLARLIYPRGWHKDLSRNSLAFSLANVDAHGVAVATQSLVARKEPSGSAPVIERIGVGTQLQINGLTPGPNESIWLNASSSADESPFYVKVELETTPAPLDLGRSLKEILVQPRANSIPELVDPDPITSLLKELKEQGWTITWISISSAATDDKEEQEIRAARIANAEYILKRAGIDGRRITSVSGRDDFSGAAVRVRFYGIR